jgi:hypothetical protein
MIYTFSGAANQAEVVKRLGELQSLFKDEISKIDSRFGPDWTGDPSVFLTVHLTGQGNRDFDDLARRFSLELAMKVGSEELGFQSYYQFVSDGTP